MTIKVEFYRILWNLMESHGVTIKVVFLSESVLYNNKVLESNNKIEVGTPKSRSDPYSPMGVPFRLILTVRSS